MTPHRNSAFLHALSAAAGSVAVLLLAAALWLTSSHPADVVFAITPTPSHTLTVTPTITPGGPTLTPTPSGPFVALDVNITNGAAPCDPIDATGTATTGTQAKVAVCAQGLNQAVEAFEYRIRYDDSRVVAPEVADVNAGVDDNPDANAGVTTFGATALGPNWSCQSNGGSYPKGDSVPANGALNGLAYSGGCRRITGSYTLGSGGVLGITTFDVFAPGSVTLELQQVHLITPDLVEIGSCAPAIDVPMPCYSGTLTLAGSTLPTFTPVVTSSPTPQPTATPASLPGGLYVDLDIWNGSGPCDVVDSSSVLPIGSTSQFAVCQINVQGPNAAFNYRLLYDDSIALVPEVADVGVGLDDNPDTNAGGTTFGATSLGPFWDCAPSGAYPKGDTDPATGPSAGRAFSGGCASVNGPHTLGNSGVLSVITIEGLALGSTTLVFSQASITHNDLYDSGSCNPIQDTPMACVGGTINVVPAAPTHTPTSTATGAPPPSATPTIPGVTVFKDPANTNLWICESAPCAGPGEGDVVINELVNGVTEPLGAWEIQIKFDHKIFNVSIDPNEALFTGFGRTPDCNIQVVTENWILFGCVSTGPVGAGFTGGPATLATVTLTPNEDLRFRLHPGNDNGVVRMILDENCEVANTLGHPQPGSVNGGLAAQCDDASVTVRILEGDLDLDCDVDVADQQLIASRYGTFFGNIFYDPWFDLEPALKDFDIDIKDVQKVFGRDGSTCENPVPAQPPVEGLSVGPL